MKRKKVLTHDQEFEIMKMVLDKFLWLGFVVMTFGVYLLAFKGASELADSLYLLAAGAIILILFIVLIVREYEWIRNR